MICTNVICKNNGNDLYWLVIAVMLVLASCASAKPSYTPSQRLAPVLLKKDVAILWQTFQKCHPSLYWYSNADTVDAAFAFLQNNLTDSLTEPQFRIKLAEAIATIRCGHTSVKPPKAALKNAVKIKEPIFPLQIKTWQQDSMVVVANMHPMDSILKRGVLIHSINGISIRQITDSIFKFISADGWHNSFKYQVLSTSFAAWYKSIYKPTSQYILDITDLNGEKRTVVTNSYLPGSVKPIAPQEPLKTIVPKINAGRKAFRKLTVDTSQSFAVLELNTFSKGRLLTFFRRSFRQLKKQNIKNLVIELRANGGGMVNNCNLLTEYITNKPVKMTELAFGRSLKYPYPKYVKMGFYYRMYSLFWTKRDLLGRLRIKHIERKIVKPNNKYHFTGNTFVIIGGFTFSAASMFASNVKGQENITIIGEETGGSAEGNTAVHIPEIQLPNSKIRVRLPLYRLMLNQNTPHNGRGIFPDVFVPPTSWHIKNAIDPKMEKVLSLLPKK